jgi:hypothetical protein
MIKNSAITLSYTATVTGLLMLLFPKFRSDVVFFWQNIKNGGTISFSMGFLTPDNFFIFFMGFCAICTFALLWWHHRPN